MKHHAGDNGVRGRRGDEGAQQYITREDDLGFAAYVQLGQARLSSLAVTGDPGSQASWIADALSIESS